ncbi:unnamed protein product, partial [Mesorhabditis spiculigera]
MGSKARHEENFIAEFSDRWKHKVDYVIIGDKQNKPYRCYLHFEGFPFSVLGSYAEGKESGVAKAGAVLNFVQRLRTSYVPEAMYAAIRNKEVTPEQMSKWIDHFVNLLMMVEESMKNSTSFRHLIENSEGSLETLDKVKRGQDKQQALACLASMRQMIHDFWNGRGWWMTAPTLLKRAATSPSPSDTNVPLKKVRLSNGQASASEEIVVQDSPTASPVAPRAQPIEVVIDSSDDDDDCVQVVEQDALTLNTSASIAPADPLPSTSAQRHLNYLNTTRSAPTKVDHSRVLGVVCYEEETRRRVAEIKRYRDQFPKQFDRIDELIQSHFRINSQSPPVYMKKMEALRELLETIHVLFPNYNVALHAVGSTVNGCGSYNSDMDLCLLIEHQSRYPDDKRFAQTHLRSIYRTLRFQNAKWRNLLQECQFISTAKVPIIKMVLGAQYMDMEIDVNVNNLAGIYNSYLVHYYSRVDMRFPELCLMVKHWAINNDICDASSGTFNSYSLLLLMIHFLQCAVTPPVLPNLQHIYPNRFNREMPLSQLVYHSDRHLPLPEFQRNNETLGELLCGFFHYYANFDWEKDAVSVRRGCRFPRSSLDAPSRKFCIYIEEPFDGGNTARCVMQQGTYARIQNAFRHASAMFSRSAPEFAKILVNVD